MSQALQGATGPHPDVAEEQAFLDHAYECLDAMRERARYLKSLGFLGGNVHADVGVVGAAEWEMDKQRRIELLADAPSALCFGRIDRADGERFHIGRRHVEDGDGEPVVTDWRTPVATPFYRATVADPMGLHLRRRFLVEERHLVDAFDEDFDDPSTLDAGAYVPDPLLAEVERARTGEMRDIVATIQAEQDVIIRAPIEECIVVQGGPGTGKTAVGLHRAAFLLYEHRELLERRRLLIVGPNRIFLRYISQVLPSLGEIASIQLTLEGLAGTRYPVRAEDEAAVARLKGDRRMVEAVRRAVFDHMRPPTADLRVPTSFGTVEVPAEDVAALVDAAKERGRPTSEGRNVIREQLVTLAWRCHHAKPSADPAQRESLVAEVRGSRELKAVLDRAWPSLTAAGVIRRLYGNRPLLARAAEGLLDDDERDSLVRKATARLAEERWTRADLALLDEAETMISGVAQTYGHVVDDGAQDLSALELRMIARRSRLGSMTVLGDLAQASSPAAQTSWDDAIEHLAAEKPRFEELTVGYRVPAPILDFANRLLAEAAPGVRASTSVRLRGDPPRLVEVEVGHRGQAAASEVALLGRTWTSVGVVAPASLIGEVAGALGAAGVAFVDGQRSAALGDHVTLLPPAATKGLEFDAVLVVEPARILAEEPNGSRILYVVLTRAVQHLGIVHAEALPAALAG